MPTLLKEPMTRPLTLRERYLTRQLELIGGLLATKQDELQYSRADLSPSIINKKQNEIAALTDQFLGLRDGLETVGRQADAALAPPADDTEEDPAYRMGGWRTQRAYVENLQRERAKLAPLSRDQWDRVKEQSATRSRDKKSKKPYVFDIDPDTFTRQAHPTWYSTPQGRRSIPQYLFAKQTLTGVDPCVEMKKVRREVMFAQRTAGVGYRGRREWNPC
jgi:hypothetical protein